MNFNSGVVYFDISCYDDPLPSGGDFMLYTKLTLVVLSIKVADSETTIKRKGIFHAIHEIVVPVLSQYIQYHIAYSHNLNQVKMP